MSDTGKTILWIVVAIVVIAVIIWLFVSAGRRREVEARRFEAGELRAKVEERLPEVQDTEDRASVTAAMAADARAEAERKAAEAERGRRGRGAAALEEQAEAHRASAEAARVEHAGLEREADRVDPDVATDDEGYRVDDAGNRLPGQEPPRGAGPPPARRGAAGASAVGAAAFAHDDDEDDLADAENPFDRPAPPTPSRPHAGVREPTSPATRTSRAMRTPPTSPPTRPRSRRSRVSATRPGPSRRPPTRRRRARPDGLVRGLVAGAQRVQGLHRISSLTKGPPP